MTVGLPFVYEGYTVGRSVKTVVAERGADGRKSFRHRVFSSLKIAMLLHGNREHFLVIYRSGGGGAVFAYFNICFYAEFHKYIRISGMRNECYRVGRKEET